MNYFFRKFSGGTEVPHTGTIQLSKTKNGKKQSFDYFFPFFFFRKFFEFSYLPLPEEVITRRHLFSVFPKTKFPLNPTWMLW